MLTPLDGRRPVAVVASRGARADVWSADVDGTIRAWSAGVVVRALTVGGPVAGLDVVDDALVVWHDRVVRLFAVAVAAASSVGSWTLSERVERGLIATPGEVDVYTVETDGPPYDRCGHRRRLRVGFPGGDVLATAWGVPPPFGAVGRQPQGDPGEPLVLVDGPEGRVELVDPYGPAPYAQVCVGSGRLRLEGPGKELRGATFAPPVGDLPGAVLAWDLERLWWCDGATGVGSPVAVRDVLAAAANAEGALVLSARSVAWLTPI